MKTSIRTTTTARIAAFGLAALPMLATVHANVAAATPSEEAADAITNTKTAYLIQVSGKG